MEKENLDNGIKPDVNESLALAGLFRKVFVKNGTPKESKEYTTNVGEVLFTKQKYWNENGVEYWLEEIELPTQKQITNERTERNYQTFQFDLGAIWMRNFVLAGKAVTAKDNVR